MKYITIILVENAKRRCVKLCSCDQQLIDCFKLLGKKYAYWINEWAQEDFQIGDLLSFDDYILLRQKIFQQAELKYPKMYRYRMTNDMKGFVRNWITEHIKKELESR